MTSSPHSLSYCILVKFVQASGPFCVGLKRELPETSCRNFHCFKVRPLNLIVGAQSRSLHRDLFHASSVPTASEYVSEQRQPGRDHCSLRVGYMDQSARAPARQRSPSGVRTFKGRWCGSAGSGSSRSGRSCNTECGLRSGSAPRYSKVRSETAGLTCIVLKCIALNVPTRSRQGEVEELN